MLKTIGKDCKMPRKRNIMHKGLKKEDSCEIYFRAAVDKWLANRQIHKSFLIKILCCMHDSQLHTTIDALISFLLLLHQL